MIKLNVQITNMIFLFLIALPGTPILALTGTADERTQKVIKTSLSMRDPKVLVLSPNRLNLRISVLKCKKEEMFDKLSWLIELIRSKGIETPKTLIFCNGTLTNVATLINFMLMELGSKAYTPEGQDAKHCLIGIYHSLTLKKYKERLIHAFKVGGTIRVAITTSALSMGINFPDVRYIIHWGPPRNMTDYHQESGRAGRDGKNADVLTVYHGQQLSFCEEEVKTFVKTTDCYRVAAYMPFDGKIVPLQPSHACCSNCAKYCACGSDKCPVEIPLFEKEPSNKTSTNISMSNRPLSMSDKEDLTMALMELVNTYHPIVNLLTVDNTKDYEIKLVSEIVNKAHCIFTIRDITEHFPVFSLRYALKILEIFHEVFDDIPNIDVMMESIPMMEQVHVMPLDQQDSIYYSDNYGVDEEDDFNC